MSKGFDLGGLLQQAQAAAGAAQRRCRTRSRARTVEGARRWRHGDRAW